MKLRQTNIQQLSKRTFDVLIVGGGINGASTAAALSAKGVSVALIERKDFASSTSQESSNLVWGGIKYLKGLEFALVRRLCRSRNNLMRAFPHSIKEIRFLTTIEKKFSYHSFLIYLSTILYWIMGGCFTKAPRYYFPNQLKKQQSILDVSKSNGGFEYSDAWLVDNDARFVFRFIRSALNHGAIATNYVESSGSSFKDGVWVTKAKDNIGKKTFSIRAKVLVNACGPYVDHLNLLCKQKSNYKHLFSKGIHLLVPALYKEKRVLAFFASDGRPFFVIPMENVSCIGTTDTRVEKIESKVDLEDRKFVLDNVNLYLKLSRAISSKDIIAERCGVRPLVVENKVLNKKNKKDKGDWTSLSRKHIITVDRVRSYVSIYGGKISDCINVGNELCNIVQKLKIHIPYKKTRWYGEPDKGVQNFFFNQARLMGLAEKKDWQTYSLSERIWRRYGLEGMQILERIRQDASMAETLIVGTEYIRAELYHAVHYEMIETLEDFLRRRSGISLLLREKDITSSHGFQEICQVLFGKQAHQKKKEYLSNLKKGKKI